MFSIGLFLAKNTVLTEIKVTCVVFFPTDIKALLASFSGTITNAVSSITSLPAQVRIEHTIVT